MKNIQVSTVKDAYRKEVYKDIAFKKVVEIIRSEAIEGQLKSYRRGLIAKQALPAFLPHGVFDGGRMDNNLREYSGLVHLDFDNIPVSQITNVKGVIVNHFETFCCFTSPSGNGLKVFIRVDTPPEFHKEAFEQIKTFYEWKTGYKTDPVCKNLSRLCFFSSDPDIHYNENAELFGVEYNPAPQVDNYPTLTSKAERLIELTKNVGGSFAGGYFEGNRNGFIYTLACNCNRYGLSRNEAEGVCRYVWLMDNKGFPERELNSCISSAYKNTREHAMFSFNP